MFFFFCHDQFCVCAYQYSPYPAWLFHWDWLIERGIKTLKNMGMWIMWIENNLTKIKLYTNMSILCYAPYVITHFYHHWFRQYWLVNYYGNKWCFFFVNCTCIITFQLNISLNFFHSRNCIWKCHMMMSSNWNIFRVTGPLCGESPITGEFPFQRPVLRSFDVSFDLCLNKRLSK